MQQHYQSGIVCLPARFMERFLKFTLDPDVSMEAAHAEKELSARNAYHSRSRPGAKGGSPRGRRAEPRIKYRVYEAGASLEDPGPSRSKDPQ